MYKLDDNLLIGSGKHHRCYFHPEAIDSCIKVLQPDRKRKLLLREIAYYRHLQSRAIDWQHIARFEGRVDTSLGIGACFELVRDANGSPAKSLDQYLANRSLPVSISTAAQHINRLIQSLYDQAIVISDLNLRNLLWQETEGQPPRLVIVDGLGHNDLIPLCEHSHRFAQRKIARTWNRNLDRWFSGDQELRKNIVKL